MPEALSAGDTKVGAAGLPVATVSDNCTLRTIAPDVPRAVMLLGPGVAALVAVSCATDEPGRDGIVVGVKVPAMPVANAFG